MTNTRRPASSFLLLAFSLWLGTTTGVFLSGFSPLDVPVLQFPALFAAGTVTGIVAPRGWRLFFWTIGLAFAIPVGNLALLLLLSPLHQFSHLFRDLMPFVNKQIWLQGTFAVFLLFAVHVQLAVLSAMLEIGGNDREMTADLPGTDTRGVAARQTVFCVSGLALFLAITWLAGMCLSKCAWTLSPDSWHFLPWVTWYSVGLVGLAACRSRGLAKALQVSGLQAVAASVVCGSILTTEGQSLHFYGFFTSIRERHSLYVLGLVVIPVVVLLVGWLTYEPEKPRENLLEFGQQEGEGTVQSAHAENDIE